MTIGIDCRLWNESGVGRYTRNLVEQLQTIDRKNEYVLFVLGKNRQEILNQVQNDNFRIVIADIRWHSIREQLKFPSIINRENLDLMHFPYSSVPIFYNKPFVVTIHDLIPLHFPTGEASALALPLYCLKYLAYKLVISQATKKAKRIITVSNATKDEIVDHLRITSKKVVVTYEGVIESSEFKVSAKGGSASGGQSSKLQLKIKNYFLYVGNAYPHKNLDRLIEAFDLFCHRELARLAAKRVSGSQLDRDSDLRQNDMKLVLVGREDYFYKRLKEKVKDMGLEKNVKFLGEVSDEELISLYRNALAFVIPSLMEGFGLPALEAMANKCLVLASDIPSLREICGDTVLYFDPHNTNDVYYKMKEIHSNDINHYSGNISKSFERAKMFSWEKMAKETVKTYESCNDL